eukprot:1099132_1
MSLTEGEAALCERPPSTVAEWKRFHGDNDTSVEQKPPSPKIRLMMAKFAGGALKCGKLVVGDSAQSESSSSDKICRERVLLARSSVAPKSQDFYWMETSPIRPTKTGGSSGIAACSVGTAGEHSTRR